MSTLVINSTSYPNCKDSYTNSYSPNSPHSGSGLLVIGYGTLTVPVLYFDLSGLPGAINITSVTLTLYVNYWTGSLIATIKRMLVGNSGFLPAPCTYNTKDGSNPWAGGASGCSSVGTDVSSISLGTISSTVAGANVFNLNSTEFQNYISVPIGIAIEQTGGSLNYFDDYTGGVNAPTLTINYTVVNPPAPTSCDPYQGTDAGGTAITIYGSGFTGASGAKFGGVSATSFVVVDDNTITCVTPAGTAGPVDVTVTNVAGTGTITNGFLYLAGVPQPVSVLPNTGLTSGGQLVYIFGSSLTRTSAVKFGNAGATSITVISDLELTCLTPTNSTGVYDVKVTNPTGTGTITNGFTYLPDSMVIQYGWNGSSWNYQYTLELNPWPFIETKKCFDDGYRTSDTTLIRYRRGLKWVFELQFSNISQAQRDALETIKNTIEPYNFIIPATGDPYGSFTVAWTNDFAFQRVAPFWTSGYKGKIILEQI